LLEDRGLIPDTGALRCDLIQRRRLDCEPWYEALRWPVELADLKSIQAKSLRIHVVENASNGLGDHGSSNDKYEATAEEVLSKRRLDLLDGGLKFGVVGGPFIDSAPELVRKENTEADRKSPRFSA
jgi:hypothetical protein